MALSEKCLPCKPKDLLDPQHLRESELTAMDAYNPGPGKAKTGSWPGLRAPGSMTGPVEGGSGEGCRSVLTSASTEAWGKKAHTIMC